MTLAVAMPPEFGATIDLAPVIAGLWGQLIKPFASEVALKGKGEIQEQPVTQAVAGERAAVLERERGEVDRAQAGDREALGAILRRYGPVLFRSVLLPRLGSVALAEEALSITYTRVVEKIGAYQWQDAGIYPWLRVMAGRIAIDIIRSRKREVLFDADDLQREIETSEREETPERADSLYAAKTEELQAKQRVEWALTKIHPRYATAIKMRVLEDKSREEVAQVLGVTVSTFDVVLHRAMAAMRKVLTDATSNNQEDL